MPQVSLDALRLVCNRPLMSIENLLNVPESSVSRCPRDCSQIPWLVSTGEREDSEETLDTL